MKSIYQCNPEEFKGREVKYKAPNRNETKASLSVNRELNVWKDFGSGKGGRAVDLVCELSGVSVSGALLILSGVTPGNIDFSSFSQPVNQPQFKLSHIQPLQNRALIQYMESREISFPIASKVTQLKEAYWIFKGKTQFALAWENDQGGYELRSKFFKGGTTPKTITTIHGSGTGLNLFEGWADYLSALVFFERPTPNTTIVLNSLVNLNKVQLSKYEKINLFLDNDESGLKAANEIMKAHSSAVNRSLEFYKGHKDFNKYLITKKRSNDN